MALKQRLFVAIFQTLPQVLNLPLDCCTETGILPSASDSLVLPISLSSSFIMSALPFFVYYLFLYFTMFRHNISVTPKMVKKVIMNLDLSKTSGPDYIPVVVLKNCEPELSCILAELFNKSLI